MTKKFIHSNKFWSNMMKKDISANLYQKCLILCSEAKQYEFNCFVTWIDNLLGSRPSQYLRHFWPPLVLHFPIFKWCLICMIQQAYKYVSLSLWPNLTFFELKVTCWNQVGGDWKRVSCHSNRNCYSYSCVSCRTISLPSFNGLRCKLVKIHCSSIYILGDKIWVECTCMM